MVVGKWKQGIGDGNRVSKNVTKLALLIGGSDTFPESTLPDCCKPLAHFRVLKKLTDHFASFPYILSSKEF